MNETLNPYQPPLAGSGGPNRPARAALADLIRRFLASEMQAFEFDEQLDEFRSAGDPVIDYVVNSVWFHYDDCDDHLVCFNKQQWDFFQRLLLVLASDCQVQSDARREWSCRQLVAAAALLAFAGFAWQLGWGYHLLILSVPFGLVSIALSFWGPKLQTPPDPYAPIIFPFATFSDLAAAYRQVQFRKTRYPQELANRRIRSPLRDAIAHVYGYVMWLIVSPVPLLFQVFPFTHADCRVIVAK